MTVTFTLRTHCFSGPFIPTAYARQKPTVYVLAFKLLFSMLILSYSVTYCQLCLGDTSITSQVKLRIRAFSGSHLAVEPKDVEEREILGSQASSPKRSVERTGDLAKGFAGRAMPRLSPQWSVTRTTEGSRGFRSSRRSLKGTVESAVAASLMKSEKYCGYFVALSSVKYGKICKVLL